MWVANIFIIMLRFHSLKEGWNFFTFQEKTMNIKLIKTEEDYKLALNRLEVIFDAPIETPESDEADELVKLVDEYEQTHYPMED